MAGLRISSTDPNKWFELADIEPKGVPEPVEFVVVKVQLHDLVASARMDLHNGWFDGGKVLAGVFSEMARAWRGWKGEKAFADPDHILHLVFRPDGVGTVQVDIRLRDKPMNNWEVRGQFALELGSLDRTARTLSEYLRV